jgi:hypothetical protein
MTALHDANAARIVVAAAIMLLMIGATAAWASGNAVKRLGAVIVAQLGALAAWAALGAPSGGLAAGVAVAFAQLAIGAAIMVRLQEAHGSVEIADLDAADASDERESSRDE